AGVSRGEQGSEREARIRVRRPAEPCTAARGGATAWTRRPARSQGAPARPAAAIPPLGRWHRPLAPARPPPRPGPASRPRSAWRGQDGDMKLTKMSHSCVRLERDGRALVIDPGGFTEPDAAVGAEAVLVTHEHPDHFDEGRLRAALDADPAAEIWTLPAVAEQLTAAFPGRVHTVGHGDTFTAAGFDVEVHGELHAVIHPDIPRVTNVGYLVDGGAVFHPG